MLQEANVNSNRDYSPASEQDILHDFGNQHGIFSGLLDTFPGMYSLESAYRQTAAELVNDRSEYKKNRSKDLVQIANALKRNTGVAELYRHALTAFMIYRIKKPSAIRDQWATEQLMGKEGIDASLLVDPRFTEIGASALGNDRADPFVDEEIIRSVFSKLPHATDYLTYNIGP